MAHNALICCGATLAGECVLGGRATIDGDAERGSRLLRPPLPLCICHKQPLCWTQGLGTSAGDPTLTQHHALETGRLKGCLEEVLQAVARKVAVCSILLHDCTAYKRQHRMWHVQQGCFSELFAFNYQD